MDKRSLDEHESDLHFMQLAQQQAELAREAGEVPVGAVVVREGNVISVGRNSPITSKDPCAHAEIAALRSAAEALGNYRLDGCSVYVTLEPCAMCAGAMLHARVSRVVIGAMDPKTGAAGSVVDLFSLPQLNHHTQISKGIRGDECAQQLKDFFAQRRRHQKLEAQPLREDALRTPPECFENLPDYPWDARYVSDLSSLQGLRMHYLDEGPKDADKTFLCLHGNPAWSYLYRKMMPVWCAAGHRVVAPDLIGFGKSDKLKRDAAHSFAWHRSVLLELVERLDLRDIVLVVQDWGGILGLTLPMEMPERFAALAVMNTFIATGDQPLSKGFLEWRAMCNSKPEFDVGRLLQRACPDMTAAEAQAYRAPFPDKGYRAALRAFPNLVPEGPHSPGASISREAVNFLSRQWGGKVWMGIGVNDPVLGPPVMQHLRTQILGCPPPHLYERGGHFLQEQGAQVAYDIMNGCL